VFSKVLKQLLYGRLSPFNQKITFSQINNMDFDKKYSMALLNLIDEVSAKLENKSEI